MVHDEVRSYWLSVITECNSSGMCKAQWLREHQIEEKRFYYWQHRFKLESGITDSDNIPSDSSRFVPLPVSVKPIRSSGSASATIRKDDMSIFFTNASLWFATL